MKPLSPLLCLLLVAGASYAQSQLPACQETDAAHWDNCIGQISEPEYSYFGTFLNGKQHGFGTANILHPDYKGDKYVGEHKDGSFNGQGTYTWANGNTYVGEYKDGKRNGQGTYTFSNGGKYSGEFKDGKYNGHGVFIFKNGDKYVGEFKDEQKEGQGTYFRADGRIGLGDWIDNKPSGRFIEYRANKSIERSGIFKDGNLVTPQDIDPSSFTRIARDSTKPEISEAERLKNE